jgi:IS30 family transposase
MQFRTQRVNLLTLCERKTRFAVAARTVRNSVCGRAQ